MKKIVFLFLVFFMASCFGGDNQEVKNAKDDIFSDNITGENDFYVDNKIEIDNSLEEEIDYNENNSLKDDENNILENDFVEDVYDDTNFEEENFSKNLGSEQDNLFISLPNDEENYGRPVMLGTDSFTYSNINNLEFRKDNNAFGITCENIGEYLSSIYSWYYWNTCRPVGGENGIFVNSLNLSGEEYFYNRIYIDKKHGLIGSVLLETGIGVTGENISEKNTELRDLDFEVLQKSDKLFSDLLK